MRVTATATSTPDVVSDVLGIIVFQDDLAPSDGGLPSVGPLATTEILQQAITEQRFKAQIGQSLVVESQGRVPARRIAVVGAGLRAAFTPADYRHSGAALARIANGLGARSLFIAENPKDATHHPGPSNAESQTMAFGVARLQALAQGVALGAYRFDKYLGMDNRAPPSLELVTVQSPTSLSSGAATAALDRGQRVARAASYARDLVNEPPGTLTPSVLADDISARARGLGIEVTVLGRQECRARGMGMFLAVAQGSSEEPRFIHLAWKPAQAKKRVVLVGKGVTFDSGGLSLKTTEGMLDMKSDMAGAAAVLSAILIAAEENLPVEVHALAACTENMPSGSAYKLGDVLRSMSGKTVEINNTDAEGRLTLADALTYGLELRPDLAIDFATLTGACVVALGPHTAGVMTNDATAAEAWMAAAKGAGEDMWPLPLPPRLVEQLKSEIADMRNTGERWGGALTAGLFLKEFVGTTPWIHVDLAGPATTSKEWGCFGKGATGFGVATIVEYLRRVS